GHVPVRVEHVAAERPEDRQEVRDDRVRSRAPHDVTGHAPRLVELLRVREHVIPAPGRRGEVLPVHEHLDVADDRDAEEVPRLALLAGGHGAAWPAPAAMTSSAGFVAWATTGPRDANSAASARTATTVSIDTPAQRFIPASSPGRRALGWTARTRRCEPRSPARTRGLRSLP